MRRMKIRCVGFSDLLMDQIPPGVLDGVIQPRATYKSRSWRTIAREKIYRNRSGRIGLPVAMLVSALTGAHRHLNLMRHSRYPLKARGVKLFDVLKIKDSFLVLTNIKKGKEKGAWVVDDRKAISLNGVGVLLIRPKFKHWEFEVILDFDEKKIDELSILELFSNAGDKQGVGSFRPNKKGPFGRFRVSGFESKDVAGQFVHSESSVH